MNYLARLEARTAQVGSCLCLGIDPHPDQLPAAFSRDAAGIESFARLLLGAALPYAAAVKVNVAFFEAFGSAGIGALERLRAAIPADVPLIIDAKRGDIGSTAERQAAALFDTLGADAVTASPYLGRDAIEPLLERDDRFVYVLCRTSNPAAADLQGLDVAGEPLFIRVARMAAAWAEARPRLGLVVGATAAPDLARVRGEAPGLAFLVPGVGAQGGSADDALRDGPATAPPAGKSRGGGLLVNVSRAIANAPTGGGAELSAADAGTAIARAAAHWSAVLRC